MTLDPHNPVIALCIQGTQAEFAGRISEARALYWQAWEQSQDDFEACIAAHYMARCQESLQERHWWNQQALRLANRVGDERVESFFASLYVNLGRSFEMSGCQDQAQHYYALAADLGLEHQEGESLDFTG